MSRASVVITAEDKLNKGLLSAKKSLMQFQQGVQKVGDTLKTAFNVTVIAVAIKKMSDAATGCTKQFLEMERKYKQLRITLGSGDSFKSVTDNIKKLSKITLSSKDEIESMVSELAGLGKSAVEINAISDAAVNLSNVTGQSLDSSMTTLLNTYNGNVKALNKLGIETSQLTKAELASGAAIDLVNQKFGELSAKMASQDTSQHVKNIKDTIGDIKQAIGDVIEFNIAPIVANIDVELSSLFEKIVSYIDYISAVITNLPTVMGLVGETFTKMVEKMFTWDTLKEGIAGIVTFMARALAGLADAIAGVIDNLVTAVIAEIKYIASSLYSELVDAILKAIGTSEEEFANSTIGKVINFSKKVKGATQMVLAVAANSPSSAAKGELSMFSQSLAKSGANNLMSGSSANATQILKDSADKAFEAVGEGIIYSFKTIFDFGEQAISGIASFAKSNFGEIFEEFVGSLDGIVSPTLDLLNKAREERNATTSPPSSTQGGGETNGKMSSFLNSVFSSFTSNMGEAGEVVSKLATNMSTMGPMFGAIATAAEYVFQGLAETVGPILNNFVKFGIEPLRELGRIVGDVLIPIIEDVMPLVETSAEFLAGIFNSIGAILGPIIQVISGSLSPVISMLANILEALMPVLKVFAKIVVTITGTIQYVIQVLQHWIATVMNWLAGLNIFGWHPFGGLAMKDPGSPGKYSDFIKNKWASVDAAFEASASTSSSATGTTVSSAGYRGATQVTINIYQQAPVVGDGGMRDFAKMIKDEFDNLNYYGVTA